jgi:hypothetical protein
VVGVGHGVLVQWFRNLRARCALCYGVMFCGCGRTADRRVTIEVAPTPKSQPVKVQLKQLHHVTQQWEYLVEWSTGHTTWTTAGGAYIKTGPTSAQIIHAMEGRQWDIEAEDMRELVYQFDLLGKESSETINFGRTGFAHRVLVKRVTQMLSTVPKSMRNSKRSS